MGQSTGFGPVRQAIETQRQAMKKTKGAGFGKRRLFSRFPIAWKRANGHRDYNPAQRFGKGTKKALTLATNTASLFFGVYQKCVILSINKRELQWQQIIMFWNYRRGEEGACDYMGAQKSPKVNKLYCLPGNAEASQLAPLSNIAATDIEGNIGFFGPA